MIASSLASRIVYREGLQYVEGLADATLPQLCLRYMQDANPTLTSTRTGTLTPTRTPTPTPTLTLTLALTLAVTLTCATCRRRDACASWPGSWARRAWRTPTR